MIETLKTHLYSQSGHFLFIFKCKQYLAMCNQINETRYLIDFLAMLAFAIINGTSHLTFHPPPCFYRFLFLVHRLKIMWISSKLRR